MGERASQARNRILSQAPKRELVPTPFWPELNGFVYLQDVPSNEFTSLWKESTNEQGKPDPAKVGAALLCKALVVREDDGTFSPLFNYPDDRDTVATLGMSVQKRLTEQTNAFFGFTPDAVAQAQAQNDSSGSVPTAHIVP